MRWAIPPILTTASVTSTSASPWIRSAARGVPVLSSEWKCGSDTPRCGEEIVCKLSTLSTLSTPVDRVDRVDKLVDQNSTDRSTLSCVLAHLCKRVMLEARVVRFILRLNWRSDELED